MSYSALLEFRKPPQDDPMKKYPPSAIWMAKRKRRIKLPKDRKRLTKNELAKYFGKAFSYVGDGGMMSYEEGRARAEAVQAQRVRGERLAILDREVENNRDRLRLQREINDADERVRMRQLDIEDRRFRYQAEQGAREAQEAERRFQFLAEQGARREAMEAENLARTDRLYDDQRRFFEQQLEVGERRRGEIDARLLEAIGNIQRQRGQKDIPLRFIVEPEEEREFEDITTPKGRDPLTSPTLSTAVSQLKQSIQFGGGRPPSPIPQPEPQPERLPTPPPSPAVKPEQRTAVQILQRERLKKGLLPVDPEQIVAGGDVDSPRTRGEVARVVENLKRQLSLEARAVEAEQERARELERQVAEQSPRGVAIRSAPTPKVREQLAEELGGLTPRQIAEAGQRILEDDPLDIGSPAPVIPQPTILQLEEAIEDQPETALEQIGRVAGGVVSAITGLGGGGGGVARVPVRAGEQAGGLGVAIQGEGGAVAEGVFGGGGEEFVLPEGAGLVEPEPEARSPEQTRELLEQKRIQLRKAELRKERKQASRYQPIEFAQLRQIQQKGKKIKLPKEQGELFLEVREPFDRGTYIGKEVGLYKVKNIPSLEGTGSGNTQKFNLTYTHKGKAGENQINPYKIVKGQNVFQEALADGKIRFVLKPSGDVSPTD